MSYEEIKEYVEKNKEVTNKVLYEEFPETSQSTIRSWKSRALSEVYPEPAAPPAPTTSEAPQDTKREAELEEMLVHSLATQTKYNLSLLEGLPNKEKIVVLKNQLNAMNTNKRRGQNGNILPNPPPVQSSTKKFGIDQYITFDKNKDEIRMEIPMDVLHDPNNKKKLGLLNHS